MGKFLFVGAFGRDDRRDRQHLPAVLSPDADRAVLCLGIFSAFMLYDIKRVVDGGETNYISATLAIYLDLYNVFQSLLSLLGIFGGERD